MVLKPDQQAAVLVKERVQEVLRGRALSEPERASLQEFDRDLERYLE